VTPEKSRRPLNLQQRSTLAGEAAAAAAEVETALATPANPSVAAFFDVDNTMMQGASIFHLAKGLHRREFFTTREILSAAWKQAYFRIVGVEDPDHVAETRASAQSFISGHTVAELEALGEEIFDEAMAHRIWPGTRALAQMHLDEGERVWLVTAAPIEIAQIIARRLGLTGALGTVAEHVDGVYTGRLVGDMLHGPAKGEAVKALAVREGERPWTAREIAEVRATLESDRERLEAEIAAVEEEIGHLLREGGEGAGHDQADVGSNTFERDHEMSMAKNARDNLVLVKEAITRLEDGTYGVCDSCGNPIGKMRLRAFPRATLCMECKQRQERR